MQTFRYNYSLFLDFLAVYLLRKPERLHIKDFCLDINCFHCVRLLDSADLSMD